MRLRRTFEDDPSRLKCASLWEGVGYKFVPDQSL